MSPSSIRIICQSADSGVPVSKSIRHYYCRPAVSGIRRSQQNQLSPVSNSIRNYCQLAVSGIPRSQQNQESLVSTSIRNYCTVSQQCQESLSDSRIKSFCQEEHQESLSASRISNTCQLAVSRVTFQPTASGDSCHQEHQELLSVDPDPVILMISDLLLYCPRWCSCKWCFNPKRHNVLNLTSSFIYRSMIIYCTYFLLYEEN
jgi:hypothetical protein